MEQFKKKIDKLENKMILYERKHNILKNNSLNNYDINNSFLNLNLHLINNNELSFKTKNNIQNILLYELNNTNFFENNIYNEINNFENKILYALNRYNLLLSNITEDIWKLYTNKNQYKYELNENEFVFENSIHNDSKYNELLQSVLGKLINNINNLCKKYNYSFYNKSYSDISDSDINSDDSNICWILFIIKKN